MHHWSNRKGKEFEEDLLYFRFYYRFYDLASNQRLSSMACITIKVPKMTLGGE